MGRRNSSARVYPMRTCGGRSCAPTARSSTSTSEAEISFLNSSSVESAMRRHSTSLLGALALGFAVVPLACQSAKDDPEQPPTGEEHRISYNNLQRLALAIHNYEAHNEKFPCNVKSADGKTLLSWRVLILPHIEPEHFEI